MMVSIYFKTDFNFIMLATDTRQVPDIIGFPTTPPEAALQSLAFLCVLVTEVFNDVDMDATWHDAYIFLYHT